ncbi:MAG: AMP-binding protein [Actinobacteria bacterium]|nr:AMP-binding protein [Actinomycetota bacterium]
MDSRHHKWDWDEAMRRVGVARDGRFNAGSASFPRRSSLIWVRVDGSLQTWSGTDLLEQSLKLAAALRALGVRPGDRVAGLLGRRPESLTIASATWRLGALFVPLFSGFGSEAVRVRLEDAGVGVLVTDAANVDNAIAGATENVRVLSLDPDPPEGVTDLEGILRGATSVPETRMCDAHDPATIMYTSGTTGKPKGCVIAHLGLITMWPFVTYCLGLHDDGALFSTADTGWSFGLYTTGFAPLTLGFSRVMVEGGFDPVVWWKALQETGAQHLATAPTGLRQLAIAGIDAIGMRPDRLEGITTAGEPLTGEVSEWFERNLSVPVQDSYGLSETGMVLGNLRPEGAPPAADGSMGSALPGFEVSLIAEDGTLLLIGSKESGRIAIRDNGFLLGQGYWGRQSLWEGRVQDGWWVTEDLATRDSDGRFWYVGRNDDMIVTAGYNVGPSDVEGAIVRHRQINDAAVVGEPDDRKGHVVVAHIVASDQEQDDDRLLQEVRALVGSAIGWHAAPRRLVRHDALPRTESGKLRRSDLRPE